MHGSVHDELDYAVKNPYIPFVVPRITRLMKLRKMHANRKWEVPIEADTEYGRSWDVSYHLTGDDDHSASGWTDIEGLENYIPDMFSPHVVEGLTRALLSSKESARNKADAWLKENLHARAYKTVHSAFWTRDKEGNKSPVTDEAVIRKQITASLQLHEYWLIDEVPDDQDASLETLEQYEARRGLTASDRGYMPEGGWLHSVPLDRVKRKAVPVLGEAPVVVPEVDTDETLEEVAPVTPQLTFEAERVATPTVVTVEAAPAALPEVVTPAAGVDDDADEIFFPAPRKRVSATAVKAPEPVPLPSPVVAAKPPADPLPPGLRTLRNLTEDELDQLAQEIGRPFGSNTLSVIFEGEVMTITKAVFTEIPESYLVPEITYA
jgi:hypothetical protein